MVKVFLLIVVGLAGDAAHTEPFHRWGNSLAESAEKLGVTPERLVYLVDEPTEEDKRATGPATQAAVTKALESFAAQAGPDDVVFVTLIGHGTSSGKDTKFNLRGADMTPESFKPLLAKLRVEADCLRQHHQRQRTIRLRAVGPWPHDRHGHAERGGDLRHAVRRATSSRRSRPKRPTPTRTAASRVLEAFQFAKVEVERAYKREGLLMTEHAMLDDNGDKEGTSGPLDVGQGRQGGVGAVARLDRAGGVPLDPKLAALYDERRQLERRVENLRMLKDSMDAARLHARARNARDRHRPQDTGDSAASG